MSGRGVVPNIHCRDPRAELEWLQRALGFEVSMVITNADGSVGHCEVTFGDVAIGVSREWADWTRAPASVGGGNTQMIELFLEGDIDAHCEQARAAGGRILQEPEDQFYGHRNYYVADPEGHVWSFAKVLRDMSLEELEAASGGRRVSKGLEA